MTHSPGRTIFQVYLQNLSLDPLPETAAIEVKHLEVCKNMAGSAGMKTCGSWNNILKMKLDHL